MDSTNGPLYFRISILVEVECSIHVLPRDLKLLASLPKECRYKVKMERSLAQKVHNDFYMKLPKDSVFTVAPTNPRTARRFGDVKSILSSNERTVDRQCVDKIVTDTCRVQQ